mmetsp:Transcript_35085/g.79357  ORF Transcript_35085/g.79357 Transcript_35085/m.79357 type:complete len:153 (-) Transcript_35085:244-702(-)
MTNKPAPKTASLYVKGVTHPLKMAMATGSDRSSQGFLMCLSEAHRIKAVNDIITAVSTKYQELVLELFASVKKLGQTLRKLQKGSADGLSGGGMSDDDKIYLQVRYDLILPPRLPPPLLFCHLLLLRADGLLGILGCQCSCIKSERDGREVY